MDSGSVQFAIHCTTCKGRLVVRNAAAIGQILPCPKCGSMVMVTPPEGYELPPDATGQAPPTAATPPVKANPTAGAPPTQATTPPPASPAPQQAKKELSGGRPVSPRSRAAQEMGGETETVDDSAILSRSDFPTPPTADSLAGEEPATGPLLPSQAALPKANWQKPLMFGGIGLAAVLALLLILGFVFSGGDDSETAQRPEEQQPQETPPVEETLPTQQVEEPTPPEPPQDEEPVGENDSDPAPAENPDGVEPELADEPPPIDEEEGTPAPGDGPAIVIDDAPPTPPDATLDDIFGTFEALVDPAQAGNGGQSEANPEEADADLTAAWPDLPLRDRPPFTPVDVALRLQDPIAAISLEGTPLEDLLNLVSGMTTIPLAIDPQALANAQVSLAAPTTLKLENTTAGDLLAAALAQHGLALRTARGCVVIEKATPAEGLRSVRYELGDLTGGDPTAFKMLVDMLRELAPAGSWSESGGPATMEIEGEAVLITQSESVHYQLALFGEKLRLARDLPLRQTPPLSPATLETRTNLAAKKLATKLRLNYHEPTSLRVILDRLEREAQVELLVDWQSLIEFGWPATSQATLTIDEGTLEEALYRLLAPMELTWRAVDADTLEITTQPALHTQLELEVYPLSPEHTAGLEPRDVADQVAIDLGLGHFQQGGGSGILWYDQQSESLIALLPQSTQRELQELLLNWRPFVGG